MVECSTRDRGAAGSSLTGVTALWSLSKTHPSLVLVQPRETCPCLIERLLMGRKDSNQTNKRSARRTVDSKIDENRCKQKYELIQVMCILYRYITLTASNCSISLTVINPFQWKKYNVV